MSIKWFVLILICWFCHFSLIFSSINFNQKISRIVYTGIQSPMVQKKINEVILSTKSKEYINQSTLNYDLTNLYKSGYFSDIYAESTLSKNAHILTFHFTENPTVESIAVFSMDPSNKSRIYDAFSKFLNNPINTIKIEKTKKNIIQNLHKLGYDFFDISKIDFNKTNKQLVIYSHNATVEYISFHPLQYHDNHIFTREMSQQPGAIFNSNELRKDREKLIKLGYLDTISSPKLAKGSDSNTIKISFNVKEKKLNKISIGLEQDHNLFYGFISRSKTNTFIESDSLSLITQLQISNQTFLLNKYVLNYTQPWVFNKFNIKTVNNIYNSEIQELYNDTTTSSKRQGATFSLIFPFTYYLSLATKLQLEEVSAGDDDDNVNDYSLNSLEFILSYDNIFNKNNPSKGTRFELDYERGNDLGLIRLGGLTYSKVTVSLSKFFSLSQNNILATRFQSGIYYSHNSEIRTYENEYFLVGGATSLRGYNETSNAFTGSRNILINLEYRYNFKRNFQFVLFNDVGNAFDSTLNYLHFGYGLGFRYITPVGPIRLDFAKGDDDIFIHFGLGQLF